MTVLMKMGQLLGYQWDICLVDKMDYNLGREMGLWKLDPLTEYWSEILKDKWME